MPESRWETVRKILSHLRERKVVVFVDGPNILRKEFNVRLEDIREIAEQFGRVTVAKVFLDKFAPKKLIEAVSNSGFTPVISPVDIHVYMAIELATILNTMSVDVFTVVSRHARCAPLVKIARERGLETVVIGFEPGFSAALKNSPDYVFKLKISESAFRT
ncbi:MAG: NYN domain-containing protein [Candidatus Baldrarchaeia archaeon]